MQLDAWVYAVAEKVSIYKCSAMISPLIAVQYEVPMLKDLAFEKFQEGARITTSPRTRLLTTANTVYQHLPLPDGDRKLHELLVDAWVMHAPSIIEEDEQEGQGHLSGHLISIPKFGGDVAMKFMGGFKQNRMWIACVNCTKKKEIAQVPCEPSSWLAPTSCTSCRGGFVPEDGKAVILGNVTINKFWPADTRGGW